MIAQDKYIIVITKSQPVGKIRGSLIHKVVSTDLLPLRERPLHDADEDAYLNLLKFNLKNSPLYFSYGLDLTNSFQRQAKGDLSQPLWMRADDRFFWNHFIAEDLMDFRAGNGSGSGFRLTLGPQPAIDPYILPIISGTMSIKRTAIKGNALTFALITRSSRHRTGTRYFSRGIDENGHVSNFNETEQIVILNDTDASFGSSANGSIGGVTSRDVHVLAYVQTRGSVPVYWADINNLKYTPQLQVRGVETAVEPAKLHFSEQIRTYGDNYLVNLVNQKGREKQVKDAYEQLVRLLISSTPTDSNIDQSTRSPETVRIVESTVNKQEFDRLHYVYFDFHSETKGFRWHRSQILLDELHEPLLKQQYFHGIFTPGDMRTAGRNIEIRSLQKSVVRTNCMDCLDRTNVIQSMLGRFSLNRMLHDTKILGKGESAQEDVSFESLFRNVWADNADTVSKAYSGTGALKTDFTRTGTRTKVGALNDLNNSITRYVRNNFGDGPRQDSFDLLSGAFLPYSGVGGANSPFLFADKRPILIQAVPYLMFASVFFISVAIGTRKVPENTVWPLRFLMLFFVALAVYCANFMWRCGMLFVSPVLPSCGAEDGWTARVANTSCVGQLAQAQHPKLCDRGRCGRHGQSEQGPDTGPIRSETSAQEE